MSKNFLRKAGLRMALVLLSFLLFIAAGAFAVRYVIIEPAAIKSTIAKSGVYSHLLDSSLSAAQTSAKKENTANIPLNDPLIKDPLKEVFTPEVLQNNIEQLIDGIYHWLNGAAPQPDFVLDLSSANDAFVQKAGDNLDTRLRSLPACTPRQIQELGAQLETNAFKLACLPPGTSISQLVQQARSNLRASKDLLPDQKITADTFKKPGESQNIFASASKAPAQFQLFKHLPWILLGILVLLSALTILLGASRYEGLHRLGKSLAVCGIIILLIPLGLHFAPSVLIDKNAINANQTAHDITYPLILAFTNAAAKVYLVFGAATLLIGGTAWFAGSKFLKVEEKSIKRTR